MYFSRFSRPTQNGRNNQEEGGENGKPTFRSRNRVPPSVITRENTVEVFSIFLDKVQQGGYITQQETDRLVSQATECRDRKYPSLLNILSGTALVSSATYVGIKTLGDLEFPDFVRSMKMAACAIASLVIGGLISTLVQSKNEKVRTHIHDLKETVYNFLSIKYLLHKAYLKVFIPYVIFATPVIFEVIFRKGLMDAALQGACNLPFLTAAVVSSLVSASIHAYMGRGMKKSFLPFALSGVQYFIIRLAWTEGAKRILPVSLADEFSQFARG